MSSVSSSSNKISTPKSSNPEKTVVFVYGRFQPPHIGHALLISALEEKARENNAAAYVIVSGSCNEDWLLSPKYKKQSKLNTFISCKENENPLPIERKVHYLSKMFPTVKFIKANKCGNTIFGSLNCIYEKGYRKFIGLFGSDRADKFQVMFSRTAENIRKKLADPNFEKTEKELSPIDVHIITIGDKRVDKANDITGASATKMREASVLDTKESHEYFIKHSQIGNMTIEDSLEMMKEIREALWKEHKEEPEEAKEKPKRKSKKNETTKEDNAEKPDLRRSSRLKTPAEGGYIPPKVIHTPRPKNYKFREDEIYIK